MSKNANQPVKLKASPPHTGNGATPHRNSPHLISEHPERYDPRGQAGKLIDSEHRGRYWWASQAVAGRAVLDAGCGVGYGLEILAAAGAKSVAGVDLDESAVEEARSRFGDRVAEIFQGDLRDLPLDDDSVDVVVCFETIEHIEEGERALGELHRVLKADGLLLVSSPNPDVYPPGNEHHVHEYRPEELEAVVGERFSNVRSYRQHPWLASAIESASANGTARRSCETRATTGLEPGGETYSIVAASDGDLPDLDGLLALGGDFEVGWWADQLEIREREAEEAKAEAESHARERIAEAEKRQLQAREEAEEHRRQARAEVEEHRRQARAEVEEHQRQARAEVEEHQRQARESIAAAEARSQGQIEAIERIANERVEAAEKEAEELLSAKENEFRRTLGQAAEREAAAQARLRETSASLLDANQSLAQLPLLSHRLEELERHCGGLQAHVELLERSNSWRLMAPLRRLRHAFRLRR